jgi:hypothetical protein
MDTVDSEWAMRGHSHETRSKEVRWSTFKSNSLQVFKKRFTGRRGEYEVIRRGTPSPPRIPPGCPFFGHFYTVRIGVAAVEALIPTQPFEP